MDNADYEDRLVDAFPTGSGGLPPLPRYLRPGIREVAVAYRQHTGIATRRIELRIIDAEGTIKDLNFFDPEQT